MSDTPKFTIVDRRKFRGDEEAASSEPVVEEPSARAADSSAEKAAAPRLTLVEPQAAAKGEHEDASVAVAEFSRETGGVGSGLGELDELDDEAGGIGLDGGDVPPAPTSEEFRFQKLAYDKAAERLEDLVRAQNPGAPPAEKIGFEHLVQQLYLSAMMQMGAGTPEGQRPRIDILGARQTIDLLEVVLDKTTANLKKNEQKTLETVLYELRMTFLELTRMVGAPQPPMAPPPGARR